LGPPEAIGFKGTELREDIKNDPGVLETFEIIRAHGAVRMGLIDNIEQAAHAKIAEGNWTVKKAIMSRSARVLREGSVRIPASGFLTGE
jgi:2-methylaconitate cis-trans-isomerase PrpF